MKMINSIEAQLGFMLSGDFAYAKYRKHYEAWAQEEWGAGYYNVYAKDNSSPTGVSLAFSLTLKEWEELSKAAGMSHQYLAPGEKF